MLNQPPQTEIQQMLARFERDGFIILRNLIDVELIDAMRRDFSIFHAALQHGAVSGEMERGRNRHVLTIEGSLFQRVGRSLHDERVRANVLIVELTEQIMGAWRFGKTQIECACPGSEYMAWHHDSKTLPPAPRDTIRVAFQLPLVDVTEANGPIEVIPGSHRSVADIDAASPQEWPAQRILTTRGDGILRDGDILHRGSPNRTAESRPMFSQIYKRKSQADEKFGQAIT